MTAARPIAMPNPRSDTVFVELVESLVRSNGTTAAELEQALRSRYPKVVVRERGLAAEAPTWYVYREGTWVPSDR
jgi:hypothetical protein